MEDLEKQLSIAIAALDRQYGKNTVVKLGMSELETWPSISTGALTLDNALGIGGVPIGRIIEVYGGESAGKTTLALSVIAQAQAMKLRCAFIDAEHALDPTYAQVLGVDLDELYISQPDYGEQAMDIIEKLIGTGAMSVIVLDSVAALVPKAELEGDMEQASIGLQARLMSKALRKITGIASQNKTTLIFINQLREKVGIMYGSPEVTSGGRALRFYASVRIDVRKTKAHTDSKTGLQTGVSIKANIVKNKVAPPYRVAHFDIKYGYGIDTIGCLFDVAETKGIFVKSGAWYKYKGETFAQGRDNAIALLSDNAELAEQIKQETMNDVL